MAEPAPARRSPAAFWLGTVPAMFGAGLGMQSLSRLVGPRLGVIMPALLVVMGIFTIANRGFAISPSHHSGGADSAVESGGHDCH